MQTPGIILKDPWLKPFQGIILNREERARKIYIIGEFTNWEENEEYRLTQKDYGNWEIELPGNSLQHGALYRLSVHLDKSIY